MTKAKNIVSRLSGRSHRQCLKDLTMAAEIAYCARPSQPKLSDIITKISIQTGKPEKTIHKSLHRAAEEIWLSGNKQLLEQLYGCPLHTKPTARDLILTIARSMEPFIQYIPWSETPDNRKIVAVDTSINCWLDIITIPEAPLDTTRFLVFLNRVEAPVDAVQELFGK